VVCIFATLDVKAIVQSDVISLALDIDLQLIEMSVRVKAFENKSVRCPNNTNALMDKSELQVEVGPYLVVNGNVLLRVSRAFEVFYKVFLKLFCMMI
jgi:hypothetical protein